MNQIFLSYNKFYPHLLEFVFIMIDNRHGGGFESLQTIGYCLFIVIHTATRLRSFHKSFFHHFIRHLKVQHTCAVFHLIVNIHSSSLIQIIQIKETALYMINEDTVNRHNTLYYTPYFGKTDGVWPKTILRKENNSINVRNNL